MTNIKLIDVMSSSKSGVGTLWGKDIDKRVRRMKLIKKNKEERKSHFNREREAK